QTCTAVLLEFGECRVPFQELVLSGGTALLVGGESPISLLRSWPLVTDLPGERFDARSHSFELLVTINVRAVTGVGVKYLLTQVVEAIRLVLIPPLQRPHLLHGILLGPGVPWFGE